MKTTLLIMLIASCTASFGQTTPVDTLYVVTFTTGPSWDKSKPPGEQPFFKEHSANLGKLRKDGIIKMGARYSDKGMIIISSATTKAAKDLIASDPGVANKLFVADVQKLNLFYPGCVERPK